MELKNLNFDKKIKRKNFFFSLSAIAGGYFVLRSLPFKFFAKKNEPANTEKKNNSRVKINPMAVSRKNIGGNNV